MSAPVNHWKLGLFVVSALLLLLGVVVVLGARSLHNDTLTYTTFFDESVQGLEIGSPVKFRGVTIGTLSRIAIAPDHRHVAVEAELIVRDLIGMGLAESGDGATRIAVPPDLRTQLASQGLTGAKFLQIDFFPIASNPPPPLPFPTPPYYIPAILSMMKGLEDSVTNAVNRIPEVADQALEIMKHINGILGEFDQQEIPGQLKDSLERINAVLTTVERQLQGFDARKVSGQAQRTLGELEATLREVRGLMARAAAEDGLYVRAEQSASALGEAARSAAGAGDELGTTLRGLQDAAGSLQRLTDALESDSDMLVKGRAHEPSR